MSVVLFSVILLTGAKVEPFDNPSANGCPLLQINGFHLGVVPFHFFLFPMSLNPLRCFCMKKLFFFRRLLFFGPEFCLRKRRRVFVLSFVIF